MGGVLALWEGVLGVDRKILVNKARGAGWLVFLFVEYFSYSL